MSVIGQVVGKIFGTDKAVETVINQASSAMDKLVYTSEEKAEDKARAVTEARTMVIEWLKVTSGQNLARRVIALIVTGMWALNYTVINALSLAAVWVEDAEKFRASAEVVSTAAQQVTSAMMLVLAFYFAAPHMGKIADVALKRFGSNETKKD